VSTGIPPPARPCSGCQCPLPRVANWDTPDGQYFEAHAGGGQKSFIGGGSLVVRIERCSSFFPEIYNDDWFFLLGGDKGLQSVAVSGRFRQNPYDPFRTPTEPAPRNWEMSWPRGSTDSSTRIGRSTTNDHKTWQRHVQALPTFGHLPTSEQLIQALDRLSRKGSPRLTWRLSGSVGIESPIVIDRDRSGSRRRDPAAAAGVSRC
jgi:hypothetical protein